MRGIKLRARLLHLEYSDHQRANRGNDKRDGREKEAQRIGRQLPSEFDQVGIELFFKRKFVFPVLAIFFVAGSISFALWGGKRLYDERLLAGSAFVGLSIFFGLGGFFLVHPLTRGLL